MHFLVSGVCISEEVGTVTVPFHHFMYLLGIVLPAIHSYLLLTSLEVTRWSLALVWTLLLWGSLTFFFFFWKLILFKSMQWCKEKQPAGRVKNWLS